MSSQEEELRSLSLSQLFARALTAASDASELNTNEEPTQVSSTSPSFRSPPSVFSRSFASLTLLFTARWIALSGPPPIRLLRSLARSIPPPSSRCLLGKRAARGRQHPGTRLYARRRRSRRDRRSLNDQREIGSTPETRTVQGETAKAKEGKTW